MGWVSSWSFSFSPSCNSSMVPQWPLWCFVNSCIAVWSLGICGWLSLPQIDWVWGDSWMGLFSSLSCWWGITRPTQYDRADAYGGYVVCKGIKLGFCIKNLQIFSIIKASLHRRFCRGNSIQFLSRQSCNFKIARVNQVRFLMRFAAAISQGFRTCLKLVAT